VTIGIDDIAIFEGQWLDSWNNKCNANTVVLTLDRD